MAFRIAEVIKFAQANNRDGAIKLLGEIEHQLSSKTASDAAHKFIEVVRAKYKLNDDDRESGLELFDAGKIGSGVERLRSGVSIVNCCRNRSENILKALPTWLVQKKVREIIIVDWASDIPIAETLIEHGIEDGRIRVVRVENEPRWILSYAFNLGFRLARYEHILKVDADITLKYDFFKKNPLLAGAFVAGDWTKAEKGQEHINGFFFVKTKDLLKIKGFNEYITTYGWDDDDIYSRLESSGLQRICVDTKSIYHIPHDDSSRLDGIRKSDANVNAWSEFNRDRLHKIRANRYIALVMPFWNTDRTFVPFKILSDQLGLLTVERVLVDMPHYVSATMRKNAETYAATEMLSWKVGPTVFHLEKNDIDHLLTVKRIDEISQFDVDVLLKGLEDKAKLSRRSVYLEFDIKSRAFDSYALQQLVLQLKSIDATRIFVSSYGQGSDRFVREFPNDCVQLKSWVRVGGLSEVNQFNIADAKKLIENGSGCYIKVTDEFLNSLEKMRVSIVTKPKVDRLYIDAQHGLGNRLRAYGSAAAIARATGRELVVVWVPDVHCECRFADLFDFEGEVIESYDDLPPDLKKYNYMEIETGGKKDEEIILTPSVDILVRSAFVLKHPSSNWHSECKEIRLLKPAPNVVSLVNSVHLPPNSIGVHVRMEAGKGLDHNPYDSQENWSKESHDQIHYWRDKSHYSSFIKRLDQLIKDEQDISIFLATDLPENYQVFIDVYGDRLFYLPRVVFDRSREQIISALADAILLSKTTLLLGSTWSSFSEIAMRLSESFARVEMSGVDF